MWTCKCEYKSNSAFFGNCAVCGAAMPARERHRIYADILLEAKKALRKARIKKFRESIFVWALTQLVLIIFTIISNTPIYIYIFCKKYGLALAAALSVIAAAGMIYMGFDGGTLPYTQADGTIGQSSFVDSFKYKNRLLLENLTLTGENDRTEILSKSSVRDKRAKTAEAFDDTFPHITKLLKGSINSIKLWYSDEDTESFTYDEESFDDFFNEFTRRYNELKENWEKTSGNFDGSLDKFREWQSNIIDKITQKQ